jgi:HNH endonuclease
MNSTKYRIVRVGGKPYYHHRLVWELANGPIPIGHVIHHKDEDTRNNALENLECVERGKHVREHADAVKHSPEYRAAKKRASLSRQPTAYKCAACGIDALGIGNGQRTRRFCSVKCKNAARKTA